MTELLSGQALLNYARKHYGTVLTALNLVEWVPNGQAWIDENQPGEYDDWEGGLFAIDTTFYEGNLGMLIQQWYSDFDMTSGVMETDPQSRYVNLAELATDIETLKALDSFFAEKLDDDMWHHDEAMAKLKELEIGFNIRLLQSRFDVKVNWKIIA